jgi:hypothetical protein
MLSKIIYVFLCFQVQKIIDQCILFVYTHFTGRSGSDFGSAYLAGRLSKDGGKTWTQENMLLVENKRTGFQP